VHNDLVPIAASPAATTTATAATTISAATTAAAATPTTAAAAESTSAAAATAATLFTRTSLVDRQRPTAVLLAIERGNRRVRLGIARHFDESETFAPARLAIVDDLRARDLTMLTEQLFEFRAIHFVAQVPDVKLLTHF
jgi:hypothetical protein